MNANIFNSHEMLFAVRRAFQVCRVIDRDLEIFFFLNFVHYHLLKCTEIGKNTYNLPASCSSTCTLNLKVCFTVEKNCGMNILFCLLMVHFLNNCFVMKLCKNL